MKPISLLRSILTVGGWTLLSRGAGFARDMMMAAYLGAGPIADAFNVAFSLPNMFRRFFAEGAFNMAFVPMFAKKLEGGEDANSFARDAFNGLAAILILFSIIGTFAMPWLVWAMASGFAGDARFDLAVLYGQIGFNYILFISLVALLSGVLNAYGHFTEAGFVPVLMNLIFIAMMFLAAKFGWDMGLTLAWAVPDHRRRATRLHLVFRRQTRPHLRPALAENHPRTQTPRHHRRPRDPVGRRGADQHAGRPPSRLLHRGRGQSGSSTPTASINSRSASSPSPSAPSCCPTSPAACAQGMRPEAARAFNRGTELALALTFPCAVALMVIALPLTQVLYQRGAFTADDTAATALVLAIYGAGLPAFVLHKVYQPLYYAREDSRSPFRFAVVSMIVNAVIAVGLMPYIGFAAAALATTLAGWMMAAQLWLGTKRMGDAARFDTRFRSRAPRIIIAAIVMGFALYGGQVALGEMLASHGWRYAGLGLLIAIGMISYYAAGTAIGAFRLSDFRKLRRG